MPGIHSLHILSYLNPSTLGFSTETSLFLIIMSWSHLCNYMHDPVSSCYFGFLPLHLLGSGPKYLLVTQHPSCLDWFLGTSFLICCICGQPSTWSVVLQTPYLTWDGDNCFWRRITGVAGQPWWCGNDFDAGTMALVVKELATSWKSLSLLMEQSSLNQRKQTWKKKCMCVIPKWSGRGKFSG